MLKHMVTRCKHHNLQGQSKRTQIAALDMMML